MTIHPACWQMSMPAEEPRRKVRTWALAIRQAACNAASDGRKPPKHIAACHAFSAILS